jgi:predicted DNA-binding protein YlxM (UPF0122 family)
MPAPLYEQKYCDQIKILMEDGLSVAEVAAEIGVSKKTLYNWRINPEFDEAFEIAVTKSEAWWQRTCRSNLGNKFFNDRAWQTQMRNRFGYSEHRAMRIEKLNEAATPSERLNVINDELSKGIITPQEAAKLSQIFAVQAKIDEVTELRALVEKLEQQIEEQRHASS